MLTATNIDLHSAQKLTQLNSDEVLISIANNASPEHENVSIEGYNDKILKIRFDDVTAKCQNQNGEIFYPIDPGTAIEIVRFVEKNKNKNFIVHCHAGISRSGAVCMFIHLVFGHKLKNSFWQNSYPNSYVLGMLMLFYTAYYKNNLSLTINNNGYAQWVKAQ